MQTITRRRAVPTNTLTEGVAQSTREEIREGFFYSVAHDLGGVRGDQLDEDTDSLSTAPYLRNDPLGAGIQALLRTAAASDELAMSLVSWGPTDHGPQVAS
jgi:hypothetical protein